MIDHITKKLMKHLSFIDKLIDLTKKINLESTHAPLSKVLYLINNRERLIQIIQSIERDINLDISKKEYTNDDFLFQIFRSWKKDINNSSKIIYDLDKLSMNNLKGLKKTTKEEISKTFSLNQFHSAYSTNALKL